MSVKFLLPCTCGEKLRVGRAQAGLTVSCTCGRELDVPTQRGLEELEPAEPVAERTSQSSWGPAQALLALGLLIAVVSGSWATFRYVVPPQENPFVINPKANREIIDRLSLTQTFKFWELARDDINAEFDPFADSAEQMATSYKFSYRDYWRWTWFFFGLAAAGLILAASGPLFFSRNRRNRVVGRKR